MIRPRVNTGATIYDNINEHLAYIQEEYPNFPQADKRMSIALILFDVLGDIAQAYYECKEYRLTDMERYELIGTYTFDAIAVICRIFGKDAEESIGNARTENRMYYDAVCNCVTLKGRITSAFRAVSVWLSGEESYGLNCAMIELYYIATECMESISEEAQG